MGHDLRFALRTILSHGWFSAAIVATLALGIGLNTMVFTLANAALLKPVPVPGGARLLAILTRDTSQSKGNDRRGLSYPEFREYHAGGGSFESLQAAVFNRAVLSEQANPPQFCNLGRVSAGMFDMLHIPPVLGRGFAPNDEKPGAPAVALLGYRVWQERYSGDRNVVGRLVRVDDKPATIIGVMPDGFRFPNNEDLWMALPPTAELEKRSNHSLQLFGVLKPGVPIERGRAELQGVAQRLAIQYPADNKGIEAVVETFHERYNSGGIRLVFLLMQAAVGFVLVIACANVANMMLSRVLSRQREMSIRSALGASRWQVMRQWLVESIVLSLAGGAIGLALAALGVHWFDLASRNVGKPYWVLFEMDYTVLAFFAAVCVVSGLAFGIAPAIRSSRADVNSALKEGSRAAGTHRGRGLSSALVVFQFALTLVLLTGAAVFVRSLIENLSVNRGTPADRILTAGVNLPRERYPDADARLRFFERLQSRLRAIPGVTHVAMGTNLPGMGAGSSHIEIEHGGLADPARGPSASSLAQSPGYFAAVNLPLLAGRDFDELDGSPGHRAAVVTRHLAERFWPREAAIGKRFRLYRDAKPGEWITVVGVSQDIDQEPMEAAPNPLLFLPYRQEAPGFQWLMVRAAGDPTALTAAVRAAVQGMDMELPLSDVQTLTGALEHQQWYLRLFGALFSVFAFIALVLASVGIYAVIAQAAASRTREIGVRMALGATARSILGMVLARGAKQLAAGLGLGLLLVFPAARVMKGLSLRVSPSDPLVFASVSVLLIVVGLFACWLPARRAARLDPVRAIRWE